MVHAPWYYMQCYECYKVLHDVGLTFQQTRHATLFGRARLTTTRPRKLTGYES
jgi:hypothetical protein